MSLYGLLYRPTVITEPTDEPVTVDELKIHLRVDNSEEDFLIASYGKVARQYVEEVTGQTIFQTTYEVVFDRFPCCGPITLPRAFPMRSVTFIKYTDSDGVVNTWDPASYIVNADSVPGSVTPVYGQTWPFFTPQPTGAVRVRYVAGLDPNGSPFIAPREILLAAIKLLVGGFYENRESDVITDRASVQAISMRYGVEALLNLATVTYQF